MLTQLYKYNNWANSLLLDTLIANSAKLPESCILLFSHIVNAQTRWLARINNTTPAVGVWQLHDLEFCRILLDENMEGLSRIDYLDTTDSPIIKYSVTNSDVYETSITDILIHVFNHGTYHRAQIARDMRLHNLEPVNTDYIQFIRVQPK
ncbi:DinB family protein [Pedobacter metabolipauper]|uniref:Putative damage-inducible protein DinB n=1 Tax=Pedobacter metabolipauper TaxID=425513 RepID=A0A4R6STE3_9SPHI|nr:DinB family protein [Pedobacter metabolipauper]TDQ07173.1 putative damage-inducible protein DinB [Pedobacter metabolipauper]